MPQLTLSLPSRIAVSALPAIGSARHIPKVRRCAGRARQSDQP